MDPPPGEELTVVQFLVFKDVLDRNVAPYLDIAVWEPHGNRLLRKQRLSGMVVKSQSELVNVELMGPDTCDVWTQACRCLITGLVSWNAVSLGRLQLKSP